MPITETPLESGQYTKLRKHHRAKWLVIPNPNTVMLKAQVNQASFGTDFAQVTYDGVSVGSYTDVKEGWTVYVSHTDNINESYFRGYVRELPTSSILYINQNSAPFADNDTLWIIKDTAAHERLPRKNGSTLYWSYDRTYNQILPVIRNLPSAAGGRLVTGGYVDLPFAPLAIAATLGTSIEEVEWDTDGGTIVVGAADESDVTIRYTEPGWYEPRFKVVDNDGRTNFFAIRVAIYPANYSSMVARSLICEELIEEPSIGWSARLRASAGDELDMLEQTEIIVISEDWFNRTRGALVTNIKFIGRIRRDDSNTSMSLDNGGVAKTREAQIEVEGIGAQLSRLVLASLTVRRKSTATVLGEVSNLTLWRGMLLLATILTTATTIHAIDFDDTSEDYAYPLFTAQDRSAESALGEVAYTINAYMNCFPDGRIKYARHMHYLNSTDKAALTTLASFNNSDWSSLTVKRDRVPRLGRVIGYAGSYNSNTGNTLALRAKAPAVVWGTGEGRSQLNRQVLKANITLAEAKAEAAVRTGAEFAAKNLVYTLDMTHPSGYDNVLSASTYLRYTHTILPTDNLIGFSCGEEKFWWLQRVSIRWDVVTNRTSTTTTWIEDVSGVNAQVIAEIAPDDLPAWIPSFPPLSSSPFTGLDSLKFPTGMDIDPNDEQPYDEDDAQDTKPPEKSTDPEKPTPTPDDDPKSKAGAVVAVGNSTGLWITDDFNRKAVPTWKDITPGSGLTDFRFDPHSGGGWAIANNGTDTFVWRADNILNPSWRATTVEGVYTQIRSTGANGYVGIFAPAITADPCGDGSQFTIGTVLSVVGNVFRVESVYNGAGLYQVDWGSAAPGADCCILHSQTLISGSASTGYAEDCDGTSISFGPDIEVRYFNIGSIVPFVIDFEIDGGGISIDPAVRYSSNNGATFADPVTVSASSVSDAGFDIDRGGSLVFAGVIGKVRVSTSDTTFGDATGGDTSGSYARAILASGGADFYMASATAISGETLWTVEGGVKNAITPNDGSNDGLVVGGNGLAAGDDSLFMLGTFGGSVKLARSTNGGTAWDFTTGLDAAAKAVRAKNADQVYVANNGSIAYSEDGGETFIQKVAPLVIAFLEVR
jgi:hypothetical protein